jgi:hypothetical protein
MGFGLIIVFIEHLQIVTTSNYSAIANSHTLQFNKSSQSAASSPDVHGNGSKQLTFPLLWVPELSPCLS